MVELITYWGKHPPIHIAFDAFVRGLSGEAEEHVPNDQIPTDVNALALKSLGKRGQKLKTAPDNVRKIFEMQKKPKVKNAR